VGDRLSEIRHNHQVALHDVQVGCHLLGPITGELPR
jgi:hypothetical protein